MEAIRSTGKRFWKSIFYVWFTSRFSSKEFHDDVQRNREAALGDPKVKTSLTSEDGQNYGTIPMPMFASRPLTTSCTTSGGLPAEVYGRTAKTANIGIAIRQIPQSTIVLGVENKIHNTGLKWF